jgi:threonine dehydratase
MVSGIAADALGARRIGDIAFEVATRTGVESVVVDDDHSVRARRLLWNEYRTVVDSGPQPPWLP